MVLLRKLIIFLVDSTGVVVEPLCGVNAARDWSSLEDFRHHRFPAADFSVLGDFEAIVSGDVHAFTERGASTALVEFEALLIDGLVVVTRLVRNTFVECIIVHAEVAAAVTRSGVTAVDDVLDGEEGRWPHTTAHDVYAVRHGAGGTVSPTGTAVLFGRINGLTIICNIIAEKESLWEDI